MSKRIQAKPLFVETPERREFQRRMIHEGWSEDQKQRRIEKWIYDDKKIMEFVTELNFVPLHGSDIMNLRFELIEKLVYDYKLYQECDKRNKAFWLNYEEGEVTPSPSEKEWFNMNPNYWFDTQLKPIYNKLYCLMCVANHPKDPVYFPSFEKEKEGQSGKFRLIIV